MTIFILQDIVKKEGLTDSLCISCKYRHVLILYFIFYDITASKEVGGVCGQNMVHERHI